MDMTATPTLNRLGGTLRQTRAWTPMEKEAMRKAYATKGVAALALQLKRTKAAIKLMACELGLTRKPPE